MKVAVLGAGLAGLASVLECERLGIQAELFERNVNVGWVWPSMTIWPSIFYKYLGDARKKLKEKYNIDFTPLHETKNIIMKSPANQTVIHGTLGLTVVRGKSDQSLENQLLLQINKTPIYYNALVNYKELAQKYDYVIVATGRETEAKEMGLWEDQGAITIIGSVVIGSFDLYTSKVYFNTEYAGTGFARLTPYNQNSALLGLYIIGKPAFQALELFEKFKQMENLTAMDDVFMYLPPIFTNGKVKKFQKDNILLVGRSAGLVDRLIGVGSVEALISGTLAARAIATNEDYNKMVKPLQSHIESFSAFRKEMDKFNNDDFDKMVSTLGVSGIKHFVYNTKANIADIAGNILNSLNLEKK